MQLVRVFAARGKRAAAVAATVGLAMLTAGCVPPDQLAQLNQGIVGGTTDVGDPAVVMVKIATSAGGSLCTGEVVAPHVVVSAAHCVDPTLIGDPNATFSIFLGYSDDGIASTSSLYNIPVTSHYENPGFNPNDLTAGNDTSVLVTTEAINIPPVYMNRDPLTQELNGAPAPLRLVGYGITDGADGGSSLAPGVRRQVTTTMTTTQLCVTGLTTCTDEETITNFNDTLISLGTPQKNTCHGDSGGPAFQFNKNGVEVVVGITSFGPVDSGGQCAQGYDDRLDKMVSFVDSIIAMVGDPPNVTPASPPPAPDMGSSSTTSGGSGKGGCNLAGASPSGDLGAVALAVLLCGWLVTRRRAVKA